MSKFTTRPLLPSPATRATLKLRKERVYEKTGTVVLEYDVNLPVKR
jgi:hypothetical protein